MSGKRLGCVVESHIPLLLMCDALYELSDHYNSKAN